MASIDHTEKLSLQPSSKNPLPAQDRAISSPHSEFFAGVKITAPLLLGVLPFATIVGISAVETGFSPLLATSMSLIMVAGTAQLAMLQLLTANTPIVVILLTAIVINLRFAMYSATLAPHLQHLSQKWKGLLACFLTDQAFAVSITHFNNEPRRAHKHWYLLGAGLALYLLWVFGTLAGALLGAFIPKDWSLDFAIPLMFIGLVVPAIKSRAAIAAGLTAGVMVVAAAKVPFNLSLITAALTGIAVGVIIQERQKGKDVK